MEYLEAVMEYLDKTLEDNEPRTSKFYCLIVKKLNVQIPAPTIQQFLKLKLN